MGKNSMYERDLLYPTDTISDPGSIHVEILNPTKNGKMPVVIEGRTQHSPIRYINEIIRIMQSDIFDRILVDIKNNVNLYIRVTSQIQPEFGNYNYVFVIFETDGISFQGIQEIES